MKSSILFFLFIIGGILFADDYRWDLVNALARNDFQAAERLINQNIGSASPQEKSLMMNLALLYSQGETALRVLALLQSFNVRPTAFDLFTAINRNQPNSVVYSIMNNGVRANGEILLVAMEKQRYDLASQFIQAGTDVNYSYPSSSRHADGMTALLHAANNNNFDMVQMLVEHGANVNVRNRDGNTALSMAQAKGNNQMADYLLGRGAVQGNFNGAQQSQQATQSGAQSGAQSGGIANFLETQIVEFTPGNYRLSGGNRDLRFTGTESFGNIGFIRNDRTYSGSYQASNGNLILIMEGRTFVYKIDSNMSFSGNGEVWVRTN